MKNSNRHSVNTANFFKNKKVLITGAGGFIGSHLVETVAPLAAGVRALVRYNGRNDLGNLEHVEAGVRDAVDIIAGDVRDPWCVANAARGMDVVFHLAALIGIPYSYHAPQSYVETNISGTLNVLQAAREAGCQKVLITSTSEVYGTAQYVPIDERHPQQAQSPYSASKIAADRIAESFFRSFALPVVIVRPFNTYGPRQSARAVIPTIITQLLDGAATVRLGNLAATRDFNFVSDVCRGFLMIAAADGVAGKELNLASQREISIGKLADRLIALINPKAGVAVEDQRIRPRNSEVERLLGSAVAAHRIAGWQPLTALDAGLQATLDWFRQSAHRMCYKSRSYNI